MKNSKDVSHPSHAFNILVGLAVIATLGISLATYAKIADNPVGMDLDGGVLTGQAQRVLTREAVSFTISKATGPNCILEQPTPTSYIVNKDCGYAVNAQITGSRSDPQRVGIYQHTKSPPQWQFAKLAEYNKAQGWDAKTVLALSAGLATWDLNLRFPSMPGEYTYRISTVNGNCKQTHTHVPRKQCQGFLEGAYKDYTVTVK